MRIPILLTSLLLLTVLVARAAGPQPDSGPLPFGPDQLEFIPALSTSKRIEVIRELLPIIYQLEPRAQQLNGSSEERRRELTIQIQDLAQKYTKVLKQRLTPEQYAWALSLPQDATARRSVLRALPLELAVSPSQRSSLARLVKAASEVKTQSPSAEERYWSGVSLVLNSDQFQVLAQRLPLESPARSPENYLFLPGLTASQGNQVLARARGLEAEMTDRMSRVRQLEEQIKSAQPEQRQTFMEEMLSVQLEVNQRQQQLEDDLLAIFNPAQKRALYSIAPGLKASRFNEVILTLFQPQRLNVQQRHNLELWSRELSELQQKLQPELEKRAGAMGGDASLDNDARIAQMVAVREVEAPLRQAQRHLAAQLLPTLTLEQLRDWLAAKP